MKLNTKLKLFLLSITIFAIAILVYFSNAIFLKGYYNLEKEYAKSQYKKVLVELEEFKNKNIPILKDWSYWDDTYEFIQDKNQDYIRSNIVTTTFEDIGIDYIFFFNKDNNLEYGAGYNKGKIVENKFDLELINLLESAPNGSDYYIYDDQILIISKADIKDSLAEKESKGSMIFAYYLNRNELLKKIETTEFSLEYEFNTLINFKDEYKLYRKDNKLRLLFFLPFANSESAIRFKLNFSSSISDLGKENYKQLFLFLIIFMLFLSTSLKLLLDRFIVNRVRILNRVVKKINLDKEVNDRVFIDNGKNDEIYELKDSINIMLEKIESQHKKLSKYAKLDSLTGVLNRRVGLKKLGKALMDKKDNDDLTICFSDINDLKVINDKLGHNTGDLLIKDVINIIKNNIKGKDFISRLGGDEFLIVFPDATEKQVKNIINQILDEIEEFNLSNKREYNISISNGIQEYEKGVSLDSFIEKADQKMYDNKKKIKALE